MEVSVNLVTRSYRLTVTEMYNRLAVDSLGTRLGVSMTILDFIPKNSKNSQLTKARAKKIHIDCKASFNERNIALATVR